MALPIAGRIALALLLAAALAAPASSIAQDKPRSGGELIFVVPSEPPSYDAHEEETFGVIHPLAPFYSTLLKVDPFDKTGTKPVGDLAETWTISKDGMVYTFKLRKGVKFHDGSEMTSKDVKASYDKIIFPPPTVKSLRKTAYEVVEVVEAPHLQPTAIVVADIEAVRLRQFAQRGLEELDRAVDLAPVIRVGKKGTGRQHAKEGAHFRQLGLEAAERVRAGGIHRGRRRLASSCMKGQDLDEDQTCAKSRDERHHGKRHRGSERHYLALDAKRVGTTQFSLKFQNRLRTSPKRTVIEEHRLRRQMPVPAKC